MVVALVAIATTSRIDAVPVVQTVETIADRLVANQIVSGPASGTWPGETDYTGSIGAGLVSAFEATGGSTYREAAMRAGHYVLNEHAENPYGDEAYLLARLEETTGDSAYGAALRMFYNGLETPAYIEDYINTDPSNAVFYIAMHSVAAHMVQVVDAPMWRNGLIEYLSRISDADAYYPVMGLGVATWSLAGTGALDDTPVDPEANPQSIWADVTLSDLPAILASHQVVSGPEAGGFYYRFDHSSGGGDDEISGYTEDAVFGLLGLAAANDGGRYNLQIEDAATRLTSSVGSGGIVREHMDIGGPAYYTYAGEVLQAIPEPGSLLLLAAGSMLTGRWRRKGRKAGRRQA